MTRVSGIIVAVSLGVCAACGAASSQEIETARSARYTCGFDKVYEAAGEAIEQVFHDVGEKEPAAGIVLSESRWYEETGTPLARGSATLVDDKDIMITAEARVLEDGATHMVSIAADVIQYMQGSPQGRVLGPDDPNRPTWVQGKLDRVAVLIHERLQGCTLAGKRMPVSGPERGRCDRASELTSPLHREVCRWRAGRTTRPSCATLLSASWCARRGASRSRF